MYVEHRPASRAVLGIAPHRLLTARAAWSPANPGRRNVNARIMWRIEQLLSALHKAGRRSVCIVDNACADGRLLIGAAKLARKLGFVAIEAKGFDESGDRVARARAASLTWRDPAAGVEFATREAGRPLPVEDSDADILLAGPDKDGDEEIARMIGRDGKVVRHD